MDLSIRSLSLSRASSRSRLAGRVGSIDSGLSAEGDFTHIYLEGNVASLRVKVKIPSEVDEASASGMLSQCDLDELFDKIHQHYPSWELFLDVKRVNHYSRYAPSRLASTDPPKPRIAVKVLFSAWRASLDTSGVRQAVEEVMNPRQEFKVDVGSHKDSNRL